MDCKPIVAATAQAILDFHKGIVGFKEVCVAFGAGLLCLS